MEVNLEKLDKAIEAAGISRWELLGTLGNISEGTWYRWRREGFPTMAILAICYVLGTSEEAICNG